MTDTSTILSASQLASDTSQRQADITAAQKAARAGNTILKKEDMAKAASLTTDITDSNRAQNAQTSAAATTAANTAAQTAQTEASASAIIQQSLASVGLGGLGAWAQSSITALIGSGMDSSDAQNWVLTNMNNPLTVNSNGSIGGVDQDALNAFNAALPGFNQRIANGYNNGAPGSSSALGAIGAYLSYQAQIQQFAASADLAPGTINSQTIGDLWASDISTNEASDRITEAVSNANIAMSNQAVGTYLTSQGLSAGTLASYYINPENTMAQLNSINTGIGAASSGFGQLSQSQSTTLAAFLATPSANGINPVSAQQAQQALTSTIGPGGLSAAAAANAGFENAATGTSQSTANPGVVSQDQLLAAVEGNAGALSDVRRAAETRGAASQGGGGFASDNAGVAGVGYGSQ